VIGVKLVAAMPEVSDLSLSAADADNGAMTSPEELSTLNVKARDSPESPIALTARSLIVYETPFIKPGMVTGEVESAGLKATYSPPLIEYL
jgi:hypothetical protein